MPSKSTPALWHCPIILRKPEKCCKAQSKLSLKVTKGWSDLHFHFLSAQTRKQSALHGYYTVWIVVKQELTLCSLRRDRLTAHECLKTAVWTRPLQSVGAMTAPHNTHSTPCSFLDNVGPVLVTGACILHQWNHKAVCKSICDAHFPSWNYRFKILVQKTSCMTCLCCKC